MGPWFDRPKLRANHRHVKTCSQNRKGMKNLEILWIQNPKRTPNLYFTNLVSTASYSRPICKRHHHQLTTNDHNFPQLASPPLQQRRNPPRKQEEHPCGPSDASLRGRSVSTHPENYRLSVDVTVSRLKSCGVVTVVFIEGSSDPTVEG